MITSICCVSPNRGLKLVIVARDNLVMLFRTFLSVLLLSAFIRVRIYMYVYWLCSNYLVLLSSFFSAKDIQLDDLEETLGQVVSISIFFQLFFRVT